MLVSCLCPTANRRALLPRALKCFAEQTYPARELIILDDGDDAVDDLVAAMSPALSVRYARSTDRKGLGTKRQRCAELAQGDVFVLWDDDDWHGPERIQRQVEALKAGQGPLGNWLSYVTVQDEEQRVWEISSDEASWTFPGTSTLWRTTWEQQPWDHHRDVGADHDLVRRCRAGWRLVYGRDLYRVMRHGQTRTTMGLEGWVPSELPAF